jgi:rhamnose utilization protein RhaD (predicted bifunctional aldolase and dehydrogenase)
MSVGRRLQLSAALTNRTRAREPARVQEGLRGGVAVVVVLKVLPPSITLVRWWEIYQTSTIKGNMPPISDSPAARRNHEQFDSAGDSLAELVRLSRSVGRPERDFVILAEGNTSVRLDDGTFLVKASGTRLADADHESFVRLELDPLLAAVAGHGRYDVQEIYRSANLTPPGRLPSIEAFLHAVALGPGGARCVIHTHPTAVTGLLCSTDGERILLGGPVFPDEAVVCGPRAAYVGYAEPGIDLARAVAARLRSHRDDHGETPRVVYLGNHGLLALGASVIEAEAVTEMAVKAARVRLVALSAGGLRHLEPASIEDVLSRPEEIARRAVLVGEHTDSTAEEAPR